MSSAIKIRSKNAKVKNVIALGGDTPLDIESDKLELENAAGVKPTDRVLPKKESKWLKPVFIGVISGVIVVLVTVFIINPLSPKETNTNQAESTGQKEQKP